MKNADDSDFNADVAASACHVFACLALYSISATNLHELVRTFF
jgi:hypothetical protein